MASMTIYTFDCRHACSRVRSVSASGGVITSRTSGLTRSLASNTLFGRRLSDTGGVAPPPIKTSGVDVAVKEVFDLYAINRGCKGVNLRSSLQLTGVLYI